MPLALLANGPALELGGMVLHDGRWFVAVAAPDIYAG